MQRCTVENEDKRILDRAHQCILNIGRIRGRFKDSASTAFGPEDVVGMRDRYIQRQEKS